MKDKYFFYLASKRIILPDIMVDKTGNKIANMIIKIIFRRLIPLKYI